MNILKSLWRNRNLVLRMAYKEMTDRYAGSNIGIFWAIIQPFFLVVLYAVVFTFVFKVRVNSDSSPIDYALFAIAGLIPWISLSEGITRSVPALFSKTSLIKQAIFPIEVLPVSAVLPSFVTLVVGLLIYLIILFAAMPHKASLLLLLLPVVVFFQLIFVIGIGYLCSIVAAYLRDLGEIITILLTILMFVTPILYVEGAIPGKLAFVMNFNLAAHPIFMYKDILYYGRINHPWSFLVFPLVSIIVFYLGIKLFSKVKIFLANFV